MGDFDERMRVYEEVETKRRCMPLLPVCARLDGRSFHSLTRGLERPYDASFRTLMLDTLKYLVQETKASMGYTQSDEISLVWCSEKSKSQIFFDGKIQKMVSTLSAMCSVYFINALGHFFPERVSLLPTFDCRVWQVPTLMEAANVFLWREQDATRNSVSMAAHSVYSHKDLTGKNLKQMQEMLFEKGINWNDYPAFFKRGLFVQKFKVRRSFTPDEIDKLPLKHEARNTPNFVLERSKVRTVDMPPFAKVINRVDVIFKGSDPTIAE